jgi:large subunit ribosomal protein L21
MAYAIFKTGGKQYRVSQGDRIDVEKIDAKVGEDVTFSEVLLQGEGENVTVGSPFIEGASVTAEVVGQIRDKKVIAFKYRRRTGYHKTKGHRRQMTRLQIKNV